MGVDSVSIDRTGSVGSRTLVHKQVRVCNAHWVALHGKILIHVIAWPVAVAKPHEDQRQDVPRQNDGKCPTCSVESVVAEWLLQLFLGPRE